MRDEETERSDVLGHRFRADGTVWRVEVVAQNRHGEVALLLSEDGSRMREVAVEALRAGGTYRSVDRRDVRDARRG